jgi:peptidoglycan/xylan/chitin deacetylase (PgdA/CDA1 family)
MQQRASAQIDRTEPVPLTVRKRHRNGGSLFASLMKVARIGASSRALILHYHRVAELSCDPYALCVTPQRFAEQLEVLRKRGQVMRLQQFVKGLSDRRLPHAAFVITFDDGYADNLHNVKPLLERHDVPATVFVASGAVEMIREFWWDELERLLLQPGQLPETLEWRVNGTMDKFELAEAARYTEAEQRGHRDWNLASQDDPSARHQVFRLLYRQLYALPAADKQRVLAELAVRVGGRLSVRATHRGLSQDEIVRLAEGGLVEIGAHTVSHTPLPSLAADAQRWEIQKNKVLLEKLLGRSVNSFAYPHDQCSAETAAIVQDCQFTCACGGTRESVSRDADAFQLPRLLVLNWDGEQFQKQLENWLSA